MRIGHWLNLLSVAFFVFGVVFVVAGERAARTAPAATAPAAPATNPVASVRQIMDGIVAPAATVIFESVSTTISTSGIEEKAPASDLEWAHVGTNAASLIEAGNLLLLGNRAVDQGDWVAMSRALQDAGQQVLTAVQKKDPEGVLAAGEKVNMACDACHMRYLRN